MTNYLELKKLGANIARLRHKRELSQGKLALDAEIGVRTLSRIEMGEVNARYTTLAKIAEALGIKMKELVDFT